MPPLYLNPETGPCASMDELKDALRKAVRAYNDIRDYADGVYLEAENPGNLVVAHDNGQPVYLRDVFWRLRKEDPRLFQEVSPFVQALLHGHVVPPKEDGSGALKGIGHPSPFLELASEDEGLVLSISCDPYWHTDFIEFEDGRKLPNIWGQDDIGQNQDLQEWLDSYYPKHANMHTIEKDFNVEFCSPEVENSTFTESEWGKIYKTFEIARKLKYLPNGKSVKKWKGSPHLIYMRHKENKGNFSIRIFFVKRNNTVYAGEIYRKVTSNLTPEENAAKKSYKLFQDRGLVP